MVKNKLEYYYLTLNNGISSIVIEGKIIPIIGVFIKENDMRDVISAKKVAENFKKEPINGLSYIERIPVPEKEIVEIENIIFNMTIEEKEEYQKTLAFLESKAKESYFLKDAFGVGDVMMRKLMFRSLADKNSK